MKYFRWSESQVMNLSYEKFTMYLASIPDYETEDDDKTSTGEKKKEPVGSFNLFDLGNR
jgi:hypothetical protein